ncbi:hypothetical protein LX16_4258 [Stackebrandtia albiflava]|uniref:ATPase domain-containing protein n=1 Tax=Stackebrandtia albiflava TaxID=406432 RepID=A0A562UYW4_9ACTN|nr:ATP-binding protein [Stackebrandtia albiflava]TWJ10834.1 hypothetical protein LX16_4258 [Stackebrandtia albiflava]
MLSKPSRLFGREREWHALARFATRASRQPQLGVVSGRRRQGKTFLLQSLTEAAGGFYFGATQSTETESLRLFATALGDFLGEPVGRFTDWDTAVRFLYARLPARTHLVVIDEFSYLTDASPQLPSILQHAVDRAVFEETPLSILLCGSAMSVMGGILSGNAPLRGRANLELVIRPFDYREAAAFLGITEPITALKTHSVLGGTPAYRGFIAGDLPDGPDDFSDWVCRTVLDPTIPLCREARYLLEEETRVPDAALYHSILAAVAAGNHTAGGIAGYVGRRAHELARQLTVLEDCQLLSKEPDVFRRGRPRYRIVEPLMAFYNVVMRPQWALVESGRAELVWGNAGSRFHSQILGPHLETLCRDFALLRDHRGEPAGVVGSGVVADHNRRRQIEIDVAVFAPEEPGRPRRLLSIGEAKWGETMGGRQVARLTRARELLGDMGIDVTDCRLACYAAAGFEAAVEADPEIDTVSVADLYRAETV